MHIDLRVRSRHLAKHMRTGWTQRRRAAEDVHHAPVATTALGSTIVRHARVAIGVHAPVGRLSLVDGTECLARLGNKLVLVLIRRHQAGSRAAHTCHAGTEVELVVEPTRVVAVVVILSTQRDRTGVIFSNAAGIAIGRLQGPRLRLRRR